MNRKNVLVPPQPVGLRRCSNCACYYEIRDQVNPLESQSFCARDVPNSMPLRMEEPILDAEGKPVMQRMAPNKPATRTVEGMGFAHRPTQPNLVCFDGYRPAGAMPGERATDYLLRRAVRPLLPLIRTALADAPPANAEAAAQVLAAVAELAGDAPAAANDAGGLAATPAEGHS